MDILDFEQLTKGEKKDAIVHCLADLLGDVLSGLRFDDKLNGDDLQARIDKAMQKAENNHTPWFAHEFIMEDAICENMLMGMAICIAEDTLYSLPGILVMSGIAAER